MIKPVKVAMIGCGAISGIYLKNITNVFSEVELIGVCDLIRERAERAQSEYNVPKLYEDMYEAFADPEVEVVLNLTRPYQHFDVTKAALEAGKHVYSEKPLGADLEEGRALVKLAKEKGLADLTLVPGKDKIEEEIRELTEGRGADTVFEVAGGDTTFEMAWQIARPGAIVVIVAMYEEPQILPLPDMYGKNLIFKTGGVDGSFCQEMMDLTACGKLDAEFLITHRCRLDQILEAYDVFEQKKDHVIKYAIKP